MRILPLGLALLLPTPQDPTEDLVRALGTSDVLAREAAAHRLKALGHAARPALEKGALDTDAEIAARSKLLIRQLDLMREIPELDDVLPGGWDRLARGRPADGFLVFQDVAQVVGKPARKRRCLQALASRALRAAATSDQKKSACKALRDASLGAPLPELLDLLRDKESDVRREASWTLGDRGFEHERAVASLLREPSPDARRGALLALFSMFGEDAAPLVLPLLRDPSSEVREELVNAFDSIQQNRGLGDLLSELVPLLRDPDGDLRWLAVRLYERERCDAAIPALLDALKDVDALVRRDAATALATSHAKEAGPALEGLLADADAGIRTSAARALGTCGGPASIPTLLRAAGAKEDVEVRAAALEALGALRAREALEPAAALLRHSERELRRAAAEAVWAIEGPASAARLASLLRDDAESVRDAVERAFEAARDPRVAEALLPLLEDDDGGTRKRAVKLLKDSPAQPALARRLADDHFEIPPLLADIPWVRTPKLEAELRALLKHEHADVRGRAAAVLLDLLGPPALGDLAPFLKPDALARTEDFARLLADKNADTRRLQDIARRAPRDVAPILLQALDGTADAVRARSLDVLAELALPETEEMVAACLASKDLAVRSSALRALVRLGATSRVPAIIPLLDSATLRQESLRALCELGAVEALPRLRTLTTDADPMTREWAIYAVAELGDRTMVPALLRRLDGDEPAGGDAVAFALGLLGDREAALALRKRIEDLGGLARIEAFWALAKLDARDSARDFLRFLPAWGSFDRPEVAEALGFLGAPELVPELRERLRHRHPLVRRGAATALGDMGARDVVPDLLPLLRERSAWVVTAAVDALGRLGASEAVPELRRLVRERPAKPWELSGELVDAAARLRAREAAPDFLRWLEDPDVDLRVKSLEALRRLRDPETRPELLRRLAAGGPRLLGQDLSVPAQDRARFPAWLLAGPLSRAEIVPYGMPRLLADLGASETLPDLVRLLEASSPDVRRSAAEALCRLGSSAGAPLLIKDAERGVPGTLFALNALRRPALWALMQGTPFLRTRSFRRKGLWKEIARSLDLTPEVSDRGWPGGYGMSLDRGELRRYAGAQSLLDAAEWLLHGTRHALILDDDRLRVEPEAQALAFWKAWWATK